jgi:hypothetical protein
VGVPKKTNKDHILEREKLKARVPTLQFAFSKSQSTFDKNMEQLMEFG